MVDLKTQTKTGFHVIPIEYYNNTVMRAVNVTAGSNGRLYYNAGFDLWNTGAARVLDTSTGTHSVDFAGVKSKMVISSDRTKLYGQYIYYGNLGEMGVWDVSSDQITQIDSLRYSPYPYGWDYDNYSISGDDKYLAYGRILFNAENLAEQFGLFPELIFALNHDGSVAFGETAIWDTRTFPIHGEATKLRDLPFACTVMNFDGVKNRLYAFNPLDSHLFIFSVPSYVLSPTNAHHTAGAGSGSFMVLTAGTNCWSATEQSAWIKLTGSTNGCGKGTVEYTLSANTRTNARTARISVAAQRFTITQAGRSCPDLTGTWTSLIQTCNVSNNVCKIKGQLNVRNVGSADAGNSFVRFYLSSDAAYDTADTWLMRLDTAPVTVGMTQLLSLRARLSPGISASGQFIIAVIDPAHQVEECDEKNNVIVFGPIP